MDLKSHFVAKTAAKIICLQLLVRFQSAILMQLKQGLYLVEIKKACGNLCECLHMCSV